MASIRLIVLSALLAAWWASGAQKNAEDFFHEGAGFYLHGTNELARTVVSNGLALFPTHPKLTNLWELLNRRQPQDQSQDDQNKKDDQQDKSKQDEQQQSKKDPKQDQQKSEDKQQQQQSQDQQQQPQDEQQAQQKKDEEQKQSQARQNKEGKPEDQSDQQAAAAKQMKAIQMTPQQAQQLLDAAKNEERTMIFVPPIKTNRPNRMLKDW